MGLTFPNQGRSFNQLTSAIEAAQKLSRPFRAGYSFSAGV
jgi:hypothetical protein